MNTLIESVQTQGILSPLIVRPIENTEEYEVISGHRRLHAAQKAGIVEIPALIYALDRDSAAIAVVDSNLHREHILPSEKAFAYKLKMEALSHQGTSRQLGEKWSVSQISESANESERQIHRYIRLTNLIPELLAFMDEGKMALSVGVELSFFDEQSQYDVLEQCEQNFTVATTTITPSVLFSTSEWNFWNRKSEHLTAKRCGYSYASFAKTAAHWKASRGWLYNEKTGGLIL